jgi:hypothetical protein
MIETAQAAQHMHKSLLLVFLIAGTGIASPITWVLNNATFSDGGTAIGYFVFDSSLAQPVVSFQISVSGGDTGTFAAYVYQNGSVHDTGAPDFPAKGVISFSTDLAYPGFTRTRSLSLPVTGSVLPESGGTVSFALSNGYQGECYNCSPYRPFVSGEVIAEVESSPSTPEPMTFLLVAPLLILLVRHRQRHARP